MIDARTIGAVGAIAATAVACNAGAGPTFRATVTAVVDGDTVDLDTGDRLRYLMVDTPELSSGDCYAVEARQANADLVLGKEVAVDFDVVREDMFGRLLGYVTVGDIEVNTRLVDRGFACVLHIPPNGDDRLAEFQALEDAARAARRGMWGQCAEVTCDD